MSNRSLYKKKILQNSARNIIKKYSSFQFISFFEDEEILAAIRKIYEYDYPISYKKQHNLNDDVYCEWLCNLFIFLNLSKNLIVLFDDVHLWCEIEIISYTDFFSEMIRLNHNKDFSLIDLKNHVVVDFSSGENEYEIRILEYTI